MTKLYVVLGGHLPDPSTSGLEDIIGPELVGLYLDQSTARSAWNGASYATVDDAHRRYFEVAINLAAKPKDVTSIEKHVIEMIFEIGTEAHLTQFIFAKLFGWGDRNTAENRILERIFTLGAEAPMPDWSSPEMNDPHSDTYWMERLCALCRSVVRPLVYLRDHEGFRLTPETLADHISLPSIANLVPSTGNPVIPDELLEPLSRYLDALPGFREATDGGYSQHTKDMHGYAQMQVARPISHLIYAGIGADKN